MNRYEVIASIGEGAYGIVLKCKDRKSKKIYAIKKFKDKDTENLSIKKVLLRELRSLRQLKHPNIIQLHGSFKQNDRLYLVFEYIKSSLLDLQEQEPEGLRLPIIKKVSKGVLKGLLEMHTRGLLHRDIKPENILVDSVNEPKIIDFGFCREFGAPNEQLTNYVATRWYRSPELLLSPEYGPEVDMWALGCVICEMIDGQPLFPGDDFLDQLYNIYERLGPLPIKYKTKILKNEELRGVNLDMYFEEFEGFDPDFIRNRYFDKIRDDHLIDLLGRLLDLNGDTRITAQEALRHPFFDKEGYSSKNTMKLADRSGKLTHVIEEIDQNVSKGSIVLKNVELNIEPSIERQNIKFSYFKSDKREERENKGVSLPVIKTLIPFKSSFKGATVKAVSKTTKRVYGNTLLNRFK